MTRLRIIVGPEHMLVERHGVRSRAVEIPTQATTADIRAMAFSLWGEIRPFVAWLVWRKHRARMALVRSWAAALIADGFAHPGPRPDLIATKPWKQAAHGEWTSAARGSVARALRMVAK